MFQQIEFEKALRELEERDLEGWEFFTESHDVEIYRQYHEDSGLYEYKIYGVLSDVLPEICAKVYMDLAYRREWDSYVNELKEVEENGKKVIYWNVNFPFPMSNRDYVYARELQELESRGKKAWVVLARSETMDCIPEKSGTIRVTQYVQSAALTSNGQLGTKAYMRYYDNPGGMIPSWLINWAAKTGVPGFLTQMQQACRGYPDYLSRQTTSPS